MARIEGRKTKGFDSGVNNLFELGDLMKPTLENQIKTMEFYRNMAIAMIVFYLEDKKIRYFELYEAFEKLGVLSLSEDPLLVDDLSSPYNNKNALSLNIPAFSNHNSTVGGNAKLPNIWTYILTSE